MKLIYPSWMRGVSKARRLFHVNVFLKKSIKESIIKIKLAHGPFVGDGKGDNNMNSGRFNN